MKADYERASTQQNDSKVRTTCYMPRGSPPKLCALHLHFLRLRPAEALDMGTSHRKLNREWASRPILEILGEFKCSLKARIEKKIGEMRKARIIKVA